jgi:uncharacterized coiled-coil DUF342 family protein
MPSVTVKRNILLRAIVTDRLRQDVMQELQTAADEVAERVRELDQTGRRYITQLQTTDLQRAMALRQQVETEKKRQEQVREQLLARRQQVSEWKNGEEVVRGTMESLVEVNEGDNLAVLLGGTEIVVEDDIVKEIRQRSPEEVAASVVSALVQEEGGDVDSDVLGTIQASE